jgi:Replication initiator protein A
MTLRVHTITMNALAATTEPESSWPALQAFLRAELPESIFGMVFQHAVGITQPWGIEIQVATEFAAAEAKRRAIALIEAWAEINDIDRVEIRVNGGLTLFHLDPTDDTEAADLSPLPPAVAHTPVALVAQFAAERGFWSLTPVGREKVRIEERQGWLEIHPSKDYPVPGVHELQVFNAITSLWASGDRARPEVETSVSEFARAVGVKRSGQNLAAIVSALESLKATSYKVQFLVKAPQDGPPTQRAIMFSLIDELDTTWTGPATSPNRTIRIRLSDQVFTLLRDNTRLLRRVDKDALARLGPQRRFARRLLIFLDGAAAHRLPNQPGIEIIDRVIDEALAASLGIHRDEPDLYELKRSIELAATAILKASDRYRSIDVIARKKVGLRRGEPRHLLRVKRATLTAVGR